MRSTLLGLTVPVLLIATAFAISAVSPAAAQSTTYTITGRIVSDEGVPLEGVRVSGWTYHDDPTRSSTAANDDDLTDAEGRYELTLAAGKGNLNVYYEKWRQSDFREFVLEADQTFDFTLKTPPPKTAKIVGIVVDAAGNPVADANVQLGYGCCYLYAEPAVAEATPVAGTATPSSEGSGSSGSAGTAETDASAPAPDEKMAYSTRPGIMPPYYDDYANAVTGADGRFSFEAYAGSRQITAWAKGFAQTTEQVEAKDNETTEVRIVLEKVPARDAVFEGRVVDAKTGLPISGAQVNARSLEWGRYAYDETDRDGRYRLETVPGWTEITVSYYRYDEPIAVDSSGGVSSDMVIAPRGIETQYYPYSQLVKLVSGDNDHDVKLESKAKPTVVLTGYVVDPDAKTGVEGAQVNVWNQDTGDWGSAITDKTGSYRILVREGHHTISAWKEGYLGGTQSFTVDDAAERVDVLLPKGTSRYAPCYDDSDCGYGYPMPMRATDAKAAEETTTTSGGTASAPIAPSGAPAPALTTAESDGSSFAAGDTSRAQTYQGSGGNLPPYDPETAAAAVERDDDSAAGDAAPVPGVGILAAIAVVGLAALLLRRRG